MKKAILTLGLALALVAGQAAPALAAGKTETKTKEAAAKTVADWSAVQAIPAGEKIVIKTKDGSRYEGRFQSATDLLVNILRDGKGFSVERERVRRVARKSGMSRKNGAAWGAAIGGGTGLGIGVGLSQPDESDFADAVIPVTVLLGAGIGAGLGALFGKGKKDVTIYEAP